jgi:hypothetical protein
MGKVLGIVYRTIATHLTKKADFTKATSQTGAVTLIQRFGSALNLNIHFHMLFLDGVYISGKNGTSARFRWVKAPTHDALTQLTHSIAQRTAHYLERQGLLERDGENSFLTCNAEDEGPMDHLQESSITYRMAAGPQQGRKVFTLQTLPDCESDNSSPATVGVFAPNSKYRSMVTPARRGKRRSTTQLLRPTKLLQKNGLQ